MKYIVALVITLAAPLLLLPVEQLFPRSYVLEEVFKAILIWYLLKSNELQSRSAWLQVGLLGFTFTFSESMLYLVNFLSLGDFSMLLFRLLFTGLLHIATFFVLFGFAKKSKYGLAVGFLLNVGIHFWFNEWFAVQFVR
jgi:hypothetical protein